MTINMTTGRLRTRSTILLLPQTLKFACKKISGFERKSFTRHNSPDSKVFGFEVATLNSGFKVSGEMTKPGSFHFGFVHLCVNGKTYPVLKHSGFVTNPEQFPLVYSISSSVNILLSKNTYRPMRARLYPTSASGIIVLLKTPPKNKELDYNGNKKAQKITHTHAIFVDHGIMAHIP